MAVHAIVPFNQAIQPFVLSVVYNYPQTRLQQQVWNDLKNISESINGHWIVIGDFNCIDEEKTKKKGVENLVYQRF